MNFDVMVSDMAKTDTNPAATRALKQLAHYDRLGMKKAKQSAKEAVVACALAEKDMALLVTNKDYGNVFFLEQVLENGERKEIVPDEEHRRWARYPIKQWNRPVPLEILEALPNDLDRLYVFGPGPRTIRDPIIAYRLKAEGWTRLGWKEGFLGFTSKTIEVPAEPPYYCAMFKWE